jgi:hypothetical protein
MQPVPRRLMMPRGPKIARTTSMTKPMTRRTIARTSTFLAPLLAVFITVGMPIGASAAPYGSAEAGFWSEVSPARQAGSAHRTYRTSRTSRHRPVDMQAAPSRTEQSATRPSRTQQALRNPVRPRGSGGYVAPAALPEARPLSTPQIVQPYNPPRITTFGDRVNSAIQDYPLQKGIGNNPVDQQQFIRQRANGVP